MKLCGIIAEYNPFHNGHLYQIKEAKKVTGADGVVVIMSGQFVQRGEPAIIDKWTRTQIALENEVDCVFELPTYFATASAQDFAKGSVALLEKLKVDYLCFGSELAQMETLKEIALFLNTNEYQNLLLDSLAQGNSYSKAMNDAISSKFGDLTLKSNDFLGLSYLSEILKNDYKIIPSCIKRISNDYNDDRLKELSLQSDQIASATAIRKLMLRRSVNSELLSNYLPKRGMDLIAKYPIFVHLELFHQMINAVILREEKEGLQRIRGMREGIENRLLERLTLTQDLDHMIEEISSRRYSKNSISRLLINTLLGIVESKDVERWTDYIRILGFRQDSNALKYIKSKSDLTFLTNMARDLKKYQRKNPLIELDIKASKLYDLINPIYGLGSEFTKKIMIKT